MSEDSGFKPQIKAPGLTPLNFNVETHNRNTNTGSVGEIFSATENTEGTEILRKSSGLSVNSSGLTPLGTEPQMNADERRCDCIGIENDHEGTKTSGRLSGLSVPLSLCGEIHKRRFLNER